MRRDYLLLSALVAILALTTVGAAIAVEIGQAFQSQTDSTDDVPVGDYILARNSDGKMVSITPIVYSESQDKESYVLTDAIQSVRGTMDLGTKGDVDRDLTSLITFQEWGTWIFVETMDLTLQREICFTVIVSSEITSLSGTTVITIDGSGNVRKEAVNDQPIIGSWKVWGVGAAKVNYDPSAPANTGDPYKGFLVLVDSTFIMTHHYNVLMVTEESNAISVALSTPKELNDIVAHMGEWRVWNTGNPVSGYTLRSTDLYRCTEQAVTVGYYDSTTTSGVAGKQTNPIAVHTGFYNFSIDIQYKSQIKINPEKYQGENMRSNIVFFLNNHT